MPKGTNNIYPTEDVTLDNGAQVLWSRRQKHRVANRGGVPVICPGVHGRKCGRKHMAVPAHAIKPTFSGLCQDCYYQRLALIGELPYGKHGSVMYLDQHDLKDTRKRIVTCGGPCGGNEYSAFPPSRKVRTDEEAMSRIVGLCPTCAPRIHTGRVTLRMGTVADFDDRQRIVPASGDPYYKIGIECRGCFKETGEKKYVNCGMVTKYIAGTNKRHWDELCGDCAQKRGSLKRFIGPIITDNKTEFHFPRDTSKPVQVIYGKCRHSSETTRGNAATNYKKYSNICPACKRDPEAYRVRMQELEGQGNGHENGNEQQINEPDQDLLKDVNSAIAVWKREKSQNIPIDEQFSRVTQAKVSRYIGGPTASDDLFSARLRRRKVNHMFPGVKSWYDDFVEFIVRGFEKGITPENIVLSMIQRRKVEKTA